MLYLNRIGAVVFLLKILMLITLSCAGKNLSTVTPAAVAKIVSHGGSSSAVPKFVQQILTEGGGKVETQISERPRGRENYTKAPDVVSSSKSSNAAATLSIPSTARTIPIVEGKPSKDSDHKTISARKGVNFSEIDNNSSIINKTEEIIKKPTITVPSDEEPYAPSHFQTSAKSNSSASQNIPKVPSLDTLEENQKNTQKYIVPIVIVILSVPFVAIIISILYKRGSDWWKYRHYRKMDFLINGIYDN